jgi:hypothetical protein
VDLVDIQPPLQDRDPLLYEPGRVGDWLRSWRSLGSVARSKT